MDESIFNEIRQGFTDDGDEIIGFRRITEPDGPSRVRITAWEFFGRRSVLTVDREGEAIRQSTLRPISEFPKEMTSDAYTGMTNTDRKVPDHPLIGTTRVYRADDPPYDPAQDADTRNTVLGNGMDVTVVAAFHTWNGVAGLDMLYVYVPFTGRHTHVTPLDLGWTQPLQSATV